MLASIPQVRTYLGFAVGLRTGRGRARITCICL
jgi:hypothetical protein